jgi:hypothetical protein
MNITASATTLSIGIDDCQHLVLVRLPHELHRGLVGTAGRSQPELAPEPRRRSDQQAGLDLYARRLGPAVPGLRPPAAPAHGAAGRAHHRPRANRRIQAIRLTQGLPRPAPAATRVRIRVGYVKNSKARNPAEHPSFNECDASSAIPSTVSPRVARPDTGSAP